MPWRSDTLVLQSRDTLLIGGDQLGLGAAGSQWGNYWTDDFLNLAPGYAPPAAADTKPPVVGRISYASGIATVSGVADSPMNMLDQGANPVTAGITTVVFYTNKHRRYQWQR